MYTSTCVEFMNRITSTSVEFMNTITSTCVKFNKFTCRLLGLSLCIKSQVLALSIDFTNRIVNNFMVASALSHMTLVVTLGRHTTA